MTHRRSYEQIPPTLSNHAKMKNGHNVNPSSTVIKNQYDCGIQCLCKHIKCHALQKYASINKFTFVLCLLTFFQAVTQSAFTQIILENNIYDLAPEITGWLVLWEGVTIILTGIVVSYVGGNGHRPSWITIFGIIQSLLCFTIPTMTISSEINTRSPMPRNPLADSNLCSPGVHRDVNPKWFWSWTYIPLFFAFQSSIVMNFICLVAHGYTYVDDNVLSYKLPIFISIIAAVRYIGMYITKYVLLFYEWMNMYIYGGYVLWYGIATLVLSLCTALFPHVYYRTEMLEPTVSILSTSHRVVRRNQYRTEKSGFFARFARVLSNKVALFLMFGIACVQTVVFNCHTLEDSYIKSVFYTNSYSNPQFIDIVRLPVIALCIILTGFVINVTRPKSSRLVATNVIVVCVVIMLSFFCLFIRCDELYLHNEAIHRRELLEYCNEECQCYNSQRFYPVCPEDGDIVFYSPCHAGCRESMFNMEFGKCKCVPTQSVSVSYCKNDSCKTKHTVFQIILLICCSLLASTIVTNLLLLLRCVKKCDRSITIGICLTLSALFIFMPGKLFYYIISQETCILLEPDACKMNNGIQFSIYINLLNICFFIIACGFFGLAWYKIQNVDLFPSKETRNGDSNHSDGLHFSNPHLTPENSTLLSARSSSTSALPFSDQNPFKNDVIRELKQVQKQQFKSETDLNVTLRQSNLANQGVTIRKDGMLTTIL